ncbi:type II toxin-antitoxin system Phd/YefM family antitoxin [Caballeronia sp. 15715]|jgi:prevent-host-death family protein|uniref:type II toxin-antitoxin system Phd/YefM family antitoxin n=1 Tax=unclassified Caballeronia TaxID=2646786 RepID=UPI0039E6D103
MPTITVNMHEAKTNLSRLVEKAVQGESVVIAKAGKPMVRIIAIDAEVPKKKKRIGFLAGQVTVPDAQKFNDLGRDEIAAMFGGDE